MKPSSSAHDLPARGHRLHGGPAGRRALRAIGYGDHGPRRPLLRISAPTRNDGQDQELVDQHLTAALQTKGRAIDPPGATPGATRMNDPRPGRADLDSSPGRSQSVRTDLNRPAAAYRCLPIRRSLTAVMTATASYDQPIYGTVTHDLDEVDER